MSKKMMDFVATNEVLNDLGTTLKNMFADDPIFGHGQGFKDLTEKTYNVMCHMDATHEGLETDQGIKQTAKMFGVTEESVMEDVVKVMMYSTIARQALTIDMLTKLLEEENE
jgi:hypothetical protein